jgi:hypothetical protein
MRLESVARGGHLDSLASSPLDGLVATWFDRAFLFFNLFVDDPRTCLDLSEDVFRSLEHRQSFGEADFYGQLVQHVRALPRKNEFLPGIAADSVLCWLLKDAADLAYAGIASVMAMSREQVAESIAEVRMALLA